MRYLIRGAVIRSENAAKPATRPNRRVIEWIRQHATGKTGLDYGCGKLRHTMALAKRCRSVIAIDSEIQLTRIQRIQGSQNSVHGFVRKKLRNVRTIAAEVAELKERSIGVAICTNVLSAVPDPAVRVAILSTIRNALRSDAKLLVTTQFQNSEFDKYRDRPDAKRYRDGWLIGGRRGTSFYAMIEPERLGEIGEYAGLIEIDRVVEDGSTYMTFARPSRYR